MRLNTRSLVFKSGIIFFLVTVLNISIFALMVFENQVDLIIENSILNSQILASRVQFQLEEILEDEGRSELTSAFRTRIRVGIFQTGLEDFILFDEEGTVLDAYQGRLRIDKSKADLEEHREISEAITRRAFENKAFTQSIKEDGRRIFLYIPFNYGDERIAVLQLSRVMVDIQQQMGFLYRQTLLIAVLILVIHGAYAYFIALQIFRPLRELLKGARAISLGDLETRVPIVREDEIGELSNAFNEMSVAIRNMHDEARGANPLTGLPGNISIAREIDTRLEKGKTFAVLYSDLDNFKAYNDKYGFTRGDDAITFVKDCLLKTKDWAGDCDLYVGHEGGDDFVLIVDYSHWQRVADYFIRIFDAGVPLFYNSSDSHNGYIESVNRQGEPMRFPLMSISIAVVSNRFRPFQHHAEIVQVAAEVKKLAKKKEGSHYVEDTRGQQGAESGVIIKRME